MSGSKDTLSNHDSRINLSRREFIKVMGLSLVALFALWFPVKVKAARSEVGVGVGSGSELGENADSPEVALIKATAMFNELVDADLFGTRNLHVGISDAVRDAVVAFSEKVVAATLKTRELPERPSQQFLIVTGKPGYSTDLEFLAQQIVAFAQQNAKLDDAKFATETIQSALAGYYLANKDVMSNDYPSAGVRVNLDNQDIKVINPPKNSEEKFTNDVSNSLVTKFPWESIFEVINGYVHIPLVVRNDTGTDSNHLVLVPIALDSFLSMIDAASVVTADALPNITSGQATWNPEWNNFYIYPQNNALAATAQAQGNQPEPTNFPPQSTPEGGSTSSNPGCSFFVGSALVALLGNISSDLHAELTGTVPHRYTIENFKSK